MKIYNNDEIYYKIEPKSFLYGYIYFLKLIYNIFIDTHVM